MTGVRNSFDCKALLYVTFALLYTVSYPNRASQTVNMSFNLEDVKAAKGVSVVHLNARSLLRHFNEFDQQFLDGKWYLCLHTSWN